MIYIEILLGLLLYISTMGYMRTFRGQSFFNFVIASIIMVFNYLALESALKEMDISRLILIVSSLAIVLFFIYKLFFGDDEDRRRESEISPSIILLIVFLVSAYIFFQFRDSRSFENIMDIKDISKQGKYEKTKDYNSELNKVNFIVGTITINNFDRDKSLANLSLKWSSATREKISSNLEDKTLLINIPNNKAEKIFNNNFITIDFYAKVALIEEKYTLLSTYIFYKKQKIILNRDKNAPQIAYTTKWNPLIYKGKRSYTSESENSIKDNYTGLIWQKSGSSKEMKWDEAKAYCKSQTTDGEKWRLPTYNELYYLADRSRYNPAIDNSFDVPDDTYKVYWSSTKYADDKTQAWVVGFNDGLALLRNKTFSSFVRCVR